MGDVLSGQTGTMGEYILSLRGGGISKLAGKHTLAKIVVTRGFALGERVRAQTECVRRQDAQSSY